MLVYGEDVNRRIRENTTTDSNGCIIWNRARSNSGTRTGYGAMWINGRCKRVSRVVVEISLGRYLSPKEYVLHKCDNPPCVNPDHLFLGDQGINMRDMKEKGREVKSRGSNHFRAKLTEEQVVEIKRRRRNGESGYSLDREYGMALGTTAKIMGKFVWAWID